MEKTDKYNKYIFSFLLFFSSFLQLEFSLPSQQYFSKQIHYDLIEWNWKIWLVWNCEEFFIQLFQLWVVFFAIVITVGAMFYLAAPPDLTGLTCSMLNALPDWFSEVKSLTLNMNKENTTNHQIAMWTDQTSWYQISKSIKHKKIKYNPKLLCGSISNIARKNENLI